MKEKKRLGISSYSCTFLTDLNFRKLTKYFKTNPYLVLISSYFNPESILKQYCMYIPHSDGLELTNNYHPLFMNIISGIFRYAQFIMLVYFPLCRIQKIQRWFLKESKVKVG